MANDLNIAVVCLSNMNRSMEAHAYLLKKGFKVQSFGTGDMVKIPGLTPDQPNCYEFGTPYDNIYKDLVEKNKEFYTKNGLLRMMDRNRRTKRCPEKFQTSTDIFDIIITCDERVYDQVIAWFNTRESIHNQPTHVINVEIPDTQEEAVVGALLINDIVTELTSNKDLDNNIDQIVQMFEEKYKRSVINCLFYY